MILTDLKASMLTSVLYTSSSCTGSFSGEMALAVVERTINNSNMLDIPLRFIPVQAHDLQQHNNYYGI